MIAACVIILIIFMIITITRIEAHSMYCTQSLCLHHWEKFIAVIVKLCVFSEYLTIAGAKQNSIMSPHWSGLGRKLFIFIRRSACSVPELLWVPGAAEGKKAEISGEMDPQEQWVRSESSPAPHTVTMPLIVSDLPADLLRMAYKVCYARILGCFFNYGHFWSWGL